MKNIVGHRPFFEMTPNDSRRYKGVLSPVGGWARDENGMGHYGRPMELNDQLTQRTAELEGGEA